MRILTRYLAHEILTSTLLVFSALLMLFAFFDLIHELSDLGKGVYGLRHIFMYVTLIVPTHIYELFPIAALIGTLVALAQLTAHSEFTVMRASGLSVVQIVLAIFQIGFLFVLLAFVVGEFIAPASQRTAQQLKVRATQTVLAQEFRSGLWVKDAASFVNVREVLPDATLVGLKIYEFDETWHLRTISLAKRGVYEEENRWHLTGISQTHFEPRRTYVTSQAEAKWHSVLNPTLLSVLLVVPERMAAGDLYSYIHHLRENKQKTARYEIALWSKLVTPLATLVMMLLALPFAYHQTRARGVSAKIFAGIMIGLAFHLVNRLFAYLGLLNNWPPVLSAVVPTLFFLIVAVGVMRWVERH